MLNRILITGALLVLLLLAVACQPFSGGCQPGDLRVAMLTDSDGIDSRVGQEVWRGIQRADQELGVCAQFLESRAEQDFSKDITELAEQRFDLIVAASPLLAGSVQDMAGQYPSTRFVVVDGAVESPAANVSSITFSVDQAAFPAGYLAAAWADIRDPDEPRVGYVASLQNPAAEQYVAAFSAGVRYYSAQKGANVQTTGVDIAEGEGAVAGQEQANSLIDLGADVIFEVSGPSPLGGLTMAKERGKAGIGADADQYLAQPNARDILLTSAIKRLDSAIYLFLWLTIQGAGEQGIEMAGTLQNDGVGLAPYHDTDEQIPDSIKQEIAEIQEAIIEGSLTTGWSGR